MRTGILAIQGDYQAHAEVLEQLNVAYDFVRTPQELRPCDALIIPGGESTTLCKQVFQNDLADPIREMAAHGNPIFGTCAGLILLANRVTNPNQDSLGLIDITVERNGYGRQLASTIRLGQTQLDSDKQEMVFIRAPRIKDSGPDVKIIAECNNEAVAVQQNKLLATTFHPELSDTFLWHRYFLGL